MVILRRHWFALLVVAAGLVRLPRPAPWWYDEAFTAWLTRLTFANMLQATRGDVHPPGFYTLEWLVARLPGATDAALRLIPAAASLASLCLARAIAQRLRLPQPAQVVGLTLMAISGWQLYYAQEARSYTLIMCWFLLGAWAILGRRWVVLACSFTGLLYTHSYGLIYGFVLGVWALAAEMRLPVHSCVDLPWFPEKQPEARPLAPVLAGAAALTLYAPWFIYATLGQLGEFQDHWIWPPTLADVITTYVSFLYGQVGPVFWTLLAALTGATLPLFVLYRVIREGDHAIWLLAYLAVAPVLVAVILSYTLSPLYLYRALIGVSVPYYLLLGWALTERVPATTRAWAAALLMPVIAIAGAGNQMRVLQTGQFSPEAVARVIREGWQLGDIVYHVSLYSRIEMAQYLGERAGYLLPAANPGLNKGGLTAMTRTAMGFPAFQLPLDAIPHRRAWLIVILGPGLDLRPERDALLAGRQWSLAFSASDERQQHIVEVYQLWTQNNP